MGGVAVVSVYRGWLIIKPGFGEPLVAFRRWVTQPNEDKEKLAELLIETTPDPDLRGPDRQEIYRKIDEEEDRKNR